MTHYLDTEYDAEACAHRQDAAAEAIRHRNDAHRQATGRPIMWTVEGAICPYCGWPVNADGACKPSCSGGL